MIKKKKSEPPLLCACSLVVSHSSLLDMSIYGMDMFVFWNYIPFQLFFFFLQTVLIILFLQWKADQIHKVWKGNIVKPAYVFKPLQGLTQSQLWKGYPAFPFSYNWIDKIVGDSTMVATISGHFHIPLFPPSLCCSCF